MFKGAVCLITGGTGSWGQALARRLLSEDPQEVRIFSRNEFAQVNMRRGFSEATALRFLIGDVRDLEAVRQACHGVDYVFHLAALKHVPICEDQPYEAMKTNIVGTHNLIQASLDAGVRKVVDVSTDKAVDPVNFYGLTKAIGEKLMIHANGRNEHTRFVCIRGGNVLGTNGSVVPLFSRQIVEERKITITNRDMTRFFLNIDEAIELLLYAAEQAIGGETFVMKMKTCNIGDLARVMAESLSTVPVNIVEVGARPGEKVHEVLVSRHDAANTKKFGDKYYVILPTHATQNLKDTYASAAGVDFELYDSQMDLMDDEQIAHTLRQGGFLP